MQRSQCLCSLILLLLSLEASLAFKPNRPKPKPPMRAKESGINKKGGSGRLLTNHGQTSWCYGYSPICGEPTWGENCTNGTLQSPIDLPLMKDMKATDVLENFPSDRHRLYGYTLFNNGDNLEIYPEEEDSSEIPTFFWSTMDSTYQFHSVDFHWGVENNRGSEHSINGTKYAMEIQFIYYRQDVGLYEEALHMKKTPTALAAIAVLIAVDKNAPNNTFLQTVIEGLEKVKNPVRLDFEGVLEFGELVNFTTAYQYMGSLPNPPCSQNVAWFIRTDPVKVPPEQISPFRELQDRREGNMGDNYRLTKPKREHQIVIYKVIQASR